MSTNPPDTTLFDDRIERYLDGLMSADEAAAFEAATANDPAVAAQIAAHKRLTAALGGIYSTANLPEVAGPAPLSMPTRAPLRRIVRISAIAASIGLPIAAAVWFLMPQPKPQQFTLLTSEQYQEKNRNAMFSVYSAEVASGFKPKEVCNTDEQFAKWTTQAFGEALKPVHPGAGAPPEPVYAGWSHNTVFSSYSGLLLTQVDGKPVMVVMDNSPPDRMVPKDDPTHMPRIFTRKVGVVWMIEITPLDAPRVITNIELATK